MGCAFLLGLILQIILGAVLVLFAVLCFNMELGLGISVLSFCGIVSLLNPKFWGELTTLWFNCLSLSLSYFLILSCNVYPFPQICLLHSWPVMHDLLFDFSLLLKLSLQAKSRIPFRPTNICMLGRGWCSRHAPLCIMSLTTASLSFSLSKQLLYGRINFLTALLYGGIMLVMLWCCRGVCR